MARCRVVEPASEVQLFVQRRGVHLGAVVGDDVLVQVAPDMLGVARHRLSYRRPLASRLGNHVLNPRALLRLLGVVRR
eukprot:6005529-Pyramimonas_sp.AAC.1